MTLLAVLASSPSGEHAAEKPGALRMTAAAAPVMIPASVMVKPTNAPVWSHFRALGRRVPRAKDQAGLTGACSIVTLARALLSAGFGTEHGSE